MKERDLLAIARLLAYNATGSKDAALELLHWAYDDGKMVELDQGEALFDLQTGQPKRKVFKAPTVGEVEAYCMERRNGINAQQFVDYYSARGWKIHTTSIKDWKACVRTWEQRNGTTAYENKQEDKYQ